MNQQDRDYHVDRTRAELDLAYRAEKPQVADAHLRLSSLHMKCLQREDERCGGTGFYGTR
jgi:hypothetical protein